MLQVCAAACFCVPPEAVIVKAALSLSRRGSRVAWLQVALELDALADEPRQAAASRLLLLLLLLRLSLS